MIFEALYVMGRDAPTAAMALGWSLLLNGIWGLFWVAGNWAGGAR